MAQVTGARTAHRRRTASARPQRERAPERPATAAEEAAAPSRRAAARDLGRDVLEALSLEIRRRVPEADLDARDPDYIRDTLPLLWLFCTLYHRAEVRGLDNIPESGPVLLVGNHSGGNVIVDTFAFTLAFCTRFGVERRFHQLAHNLVLLLTGKIPLLPDLRRYGTVAASHHNAERALASGSAVLVYPGGDHETFRPTWESARVDFDGRKGFVRLALNNDAPIVPVVAIGGQETALFLSRGSAIARALRLDRVFRLKTVSISLALPWGLNVSDMALHWPLPAKITVEVLPPIRLRERFGPHPDVDEVYDHVTSVMQETLTRLQQERRFPVLG